MSSSQFENFVITFFDAIFFSQVIETLVTTLVHQLMTNRRDKTVIACCERFIRSVLRVMVVCEVEKRGSSSSAVLVTNSGSSKRRR